MKKKASRIVLLAAAVVLITFVVSEPANATARGCNRVIRGGPQSYSFSVTVVDEHTKIESVDYWLITEESHAHRELILSRIYARKLFGETRPYWMRTAKLDIVEGRNFKGRAIGFSYELKWKSS